MNFYDAFVDEMDKIAKTRYQKEYERLLRENPAKAQAMQQRMTAAGATVKGGHQPGQTVLRAQQPAAAPAPGRYKPQMQPGTDAATYIQRKRAQEAAKAKLPAMRQAAAARGKGGFFSRIGKSISGMSRGRKIGLGAGLAGGLALGGAALGYGAGKSND